MEENNNLYYLLGKFSRIGTPYPLNKSLNINTPGRTFYILTGVHCVCDYAYTHTHTHTLSAPDHPLNYQRPGLAVGEREKQIGNH